jgi:hypothetical protein
MPAHPWCVRTTGAEPLFASPEDAYAEVDRQTAAGQSAVVLHWEDGQYRVFREYVPCEGCGDRVSRGARFCGPGCAGLDEPERYPL